MTPKGIIKNPLTGQPLPVYQNGWYEVYKGWYANGWLSKEDVVKLIESDNGRSKNENL